MASFSASYFELSSPETLVGVDWSRTWLILLEDGSELLLSMENDAEFDSAVAETTLSNFDRLKFELCKIYLPPSILGGQLSIWRRPLSLLWEITLLPEAISNEIELGDGYSETSLLLIALAYILVSSVCYLVLNCCGRPCECKEVIDMTFFAKEWAPLPSISSKLRAGEFSIFICLSAWSYSVFYDDVILLKFRLGDE